MRLLYTMTGNPAKFILASSFENETDLHDFLALADPTWPWLVVQGQFDEPPAVLTAANFPRNATGWLCLPSVKPNSALREMLAEATLLLLHA